MRLTLNPNSIDDYRTFIAASDEASVREKYPHAQCVPREGSFKIYERRGDLWIAMSCTCETEKEAWADAAKAIEGKR